MKTVPLAVPKSFGQSRVVELAWRYVCSAQPRKKGDFKFESGAAVGSLKFFCGQVLVATYAFRMAVFEAFQAVLVSKETEKKAKKKKCFF